jgi:hypothetical protein
MIFIMGKLIFLNNTKNLNTKKIFLCNRSLHFFKSAYELQDYIDFINI